MKKPFTGLHFELTNQCNLRCTHCYNIEYLDSSDDDIDVETIKRIIDKSLEIGCRDIGFSGGEPFMRKDILELITYAKDHPIHILTNGMLISQKVINQLNAIKNLLIEFRISIDGLKSHKNIRGIPYKYALNGVKRLLDNGYVTTVNTMITNENIDELMEMYELFKSMGVDRWRLGFIFGQGNASKNSLKFEGTEEQFLKIKELIVKHMKEPEVFELDVSKLYRSGIFEGAHLVQYNLDSHPCSYQGALTVRPNGDVTYCPSLDMSYGNILKDPIDKILNNPEWLRVYNFTPRQLPQKCQNCDLLKHCGGGCRADSYYDSNDLYSYSELTCKLVEFYAREIYPLLSQIISEPFII